MMKRNAMGEKLMLNRQNSSNKKSIDEKKNKKNRFLISVNVIGSAGPIRFVVKEDDDVSSVIDISLKTYCREGRLPVLGSDANNFLLYCPKAGFDAMNPWEPIGRSGERNFVLCKKREVPPQMTEARSQMIEHKTLGWKAWLNKSFISFKILSH
ncbi:uncharacterized protein At4g22758 [Jatropha curcas]|uniref:uncharacterized protein At4g22758 n=1 Tax=Jatropha curcas TaxID=180498 RepID=UPI0005FB398F|nr:uncharacterized protein At4g22758 [Jatropha curcas]